MSLARPRNRQAAVRTFIATLLVAAASVHAQTFSGLGRLPGAQQSIPRAMSADGTVIVGTSGTSTTWLGHAFRWTAADGMQDLGTLSGQYSEALGISADGLTIVGYSGSRAYRWTAATGMVVIGSYPTWSTSFASSASADGSVITGYGANSSGDRAFRWTGGEPVGLGSLPVQGSTTYANAISADGLVVVGYGMSYNTYHAFRWSAATGMVMLEPTAGWSPSYATATNSDGSVVVGYATRAFRWTQATGTTPLPLLPGDGYSRAHAISADGTIIVGSATSTSDHALIWDPVGGVSNLNTVLAELGVDLTGWTLTSATAISADGRTVAGYGLHNGITEAWLATLGQPCGSADFNHDGDTATDADIEAFFACLSGNCCPTCATADFNGDGDSGTDTDIEAFFRVLAGGTC